MLCTIAIAFGAWLGLPRLLPVARNVCDTDTCDLQQCDLQQHDLSYLMFFFLLATCVFCAVIPIPLTRCTSSMILVLFLFHTHIDTHNV